MRLVLGNRYLVVLLLLATLLLSACGGAAPSPTAAPKAASAPAAKTGDAASQASGEPFKLGLVVAFTGRYAPLGGQTKTAVELAVDKFNAKGGVAGHKIQLIVADDEGDQAKAQQLATRMVSEDKVNALMGSVVTANSIVISQVAEKAKIPHIYWGPSAKIKDGKKYVFHGQPDVNVEAAAMIKFLNEKLKLKNIGALYDENPYGTEAMEATRGAAQKGGVNIVAAEKYGGADTDVTPQLTRVKNSNADILFILGTAPTPAIIVKQRKQLGMEMTVFGASGVPNAQFLEVGADAAQGAYVVTNIDAANPPPFQKELIDTWKAKASGEPQLFAAIGWEAVHLYAAAIEKNGGKLDGDSIVSGLEQMQGYTGVFGPRQYTATDHNGLAPESIIVAQVKGSTYLPVK